MRVKGIIYTLLYFVVASNCASSKKYHEDQIYRLESHVGQDGQYKYGFESDRSARDEVRGSDGITRGFYAYEDENGKQQYVGYTADSKGFHVNGDVVQDTPEVAAAKKAHLEAFRRAEEQAPKRPSRRDEELFEIYISKTTTPKPVVPFPVNNVRSSFPVYNHGSNDYNRKPAIHTPEKPEPIQFSTSSLNEPCHGPLCNLKYLEVQKTVVTEAYPRNQGYVPQSNHFLRTDVNNLNDYRRQVPAHADYSSALLAAAKAYTEIIGRSNNS